MSTIFRNAVWLVAAVATTAPSYAAIIRVDHDATGNNDGSTWEHARTSLQAAIVAANAGDQLWVAEGTYKPSVAYNGATDRHKTFHMKPGVGVYGGFRGRVVVDQQVEYEGESAVTERNEVLYETTLDGNISEDPNDAFHVVFYDGNDDENVTKLSGFTIRGGRADGDTEINQKGAGIIVTFDLFDQSAGPALNRLIIEENYATSGGAGLWMRGKATTHATNCRFQGNTVVDGYGGGALAEEGRGVLQNCVFYDNECVDGAGGGFAALSTLTEFVASADLTNCTFYGNTVGGDAEDNFGGAIYTNLTNPPQVTVENSIAWGNTPEQIEPGSLSIYVRRSDIQDGSWWDLADGDNNISADPLFRDPANGILTVRHCSPCIDVGNDDMVDPDDTNVDDNGATEDVVPWDAKFKKMRIVQIFATSPDPNDAGVVDMGSMEECPGDVDGDGTVGIQDLSLMLSCFGSDNCATDNCCRANFFDCNDDVINLSDLAYLLSNFGNDCSPEGFLFSGGSGRVTITVPGFDTGGYTGSGFKGENEHFVFDAVFQNSDTADDWIGAGVIVTASNGTTFRLVPNAGSPPVPTSSTPEKYTTFFSAPYGVNANNRFNNPFPTGGILGKYSGSGSASYTTTNLNASWYDMNTTSNDGPAAVFRLVIDVSAVSGANTGGGFGSVYFTTGSPGSGDIKVADMTFDVDHKYTDSGSTVTTGSFYVTD